MQAIALIGDSPGFSFTTISISWEIDFDFRLLCPIYLIFWLFRTSFHKDVIKLIPRLMSKSSLQDKIFCQNAFLQSAAA